MIAWDLLGLQDTIDITHLIRIKGGRTLYEHAAIVNSRDGSQNVRLARLAEGKTGIHQINRNIPFDAEVELVPIKVFVVTVYHYDMQPQRVKAFHIFENAERYIVQQIHIIKGYNFDAWKDKEGWIVWNKDEDRLQSAFYVKTADKSDVLDLF